jgi:spermidine synthase
MKTFIYPEMMVHVGLCTHKLPTSVILASNTPELLQDELARHKSSDVVLVNADALLDAFRDAADKSVDVVLLDTLCSDAVVLAHINRTLKEDGVLVMQHVHLDDVASNTALIQNLGNTFIIVMPYHLEDGTTLLLCSKKYHPTADVILQRSDLIEGHQYYNCDIHIAAFAMPQYVRKNYLGVIKN